MANECDRDPSSDFNPRSLRNPFNPIKRTDNECDRDPIQTIILGIGENYVNSWQNWGLFCGSVGDSPCAVP